MHPNSSASSSLDTGIKPSSDFGFAVILKQTNQLTSGDIAFVLNERWKPKNQAEVPTSIQRRKGDEVTRRLSIELLSRFPWLAVSRHEEHEGLWCSVCVTMRISNSGGGWSALSGDGGQKWVVSS